MQIHKKGPTRAQRRPVGPPSKVRQYQRRLSAEVAQTLVEAYTKGARVDELAVRYGIHRNTVMKHLDRASVRRRWRKLSETDINSACQLFANGLSLAKIGERFDVSPSTVHYALRKVGMEMRSPQNRRIGI